MASAGGPPTSIGAKKKLNREDFIMKDKTGETLMKKPGQINGLDFQIKNLNDCTVYIFDTTAQVSTKETLTSNLSSHLFSLFVGVNKTFF